MKLIVWVCPWVPYSAMALWPVVLVKHPGLKTNTKLLRHECIHHRQQTELFILPFYVLYGLNYVFNLFRYRNHLRAYREIVFEREAFANDAQRGYLAKRKAFAFMEYLFSKQG